MTKTQRYKIDRIIVGNQLTIMRLLRNLHAAHQTEVDVRVHDVKEWWRNEFGEEVGFSTHFGDEPPVRSE